MIYQNDDPHMKDKKYSIVSDGWGYKIIEYVNGCRKTQLTLSSESEKMAFVKRLENGGWYESVRS